MNYHFRKFLIAAAFFIVFLGTSSSVRAATLSLSTPQTTTADVAVDIILDPEGENINSLDLTIAFPSELLSFHGYTDASAIPLWIIAPKEERPGRIHLTGVIPGGLERLYDPLKPQATALRVAQLHFRVLHAGSAPLSIENATLLRNDGQGSSAAVRIEGATVPLSQNQVGAALGESTVPLESFPVTITDSSILGRTPQLAVFAATDAANGIERYEAKIGRGRFHIVESPLPLPRQPFSYMLTIRAYAYGGASRDVTIRVPGNPVLARGLVALTIITAIVLLYLFIRRRKRQPFHEQV